MNHGKHMPRVNSQMSYLRVNFTNVLKVNTARKQYQKKTNGLFKPVLARYSTTSGLVQFSFNIICSKEVSM